MMIIQFNIVLSESSLIITPDIYQYTGDSLLQYTWYGDDYFEY